MKRQTIFIFFVLICVFLVSSEAWATREPRRPPKKDTGTSPHNVPGPGETGKPGIGTDRWWDDAFEDSDHNSDNPPPSHGGGVSHDPSDPNYIPPPSHGEGDTADTDAVANDTSQGTQGGIEGIIGSDTTATDFISFDKIHTLGPKKAAIGLGALHEIFNPEESVPRETGDSVPK